MAQRRNQWWQPKEGISREVITADIQRYLGPDALVKPGKENGYWITAYRALTSEMVQDLKTDSSRWRQEQRGGGGGRSGAHGRDTSKRTNRPNKLTAAPAYTQSQIHESRQYWGPTTPAVDPAAMEPQRPAYSEPARQPQPSSYQTAPPPQQSYSTQPTAGYGYPPQQQAPSASPFSTASSTSQYGSSASYSPGASAGYTPSSHSTQQYVATPGIGYPAADSQPRTAPSYGGYQPQAPREDPYAAYAAASQQGGYQAASAAGYGAREPAYAPQPQSRYFGYTPPDYLVFR
ncbi:hypothetical protein K402DRAFT_411291 [Aulographum hederae CBS 113979]|uniref:Transcription factor RfeG n=1 Tax=Aulographum hederae CBS 113979 TaxID=1176131 RepID=A0A6G1H697_9PEZI|nr:hypothetical protein K402DRAFT_411291 [Aulographum hederae CBS 113979]